MDLQNINLLSSGGFEKRFGNSVFNSAAMDSGAAVHGLGYYRQISASEWLVTICGSKFFVSSSLNGTMTDSTGAVTITSGQNNIWTYSQMNDLAIFVGGNRAADVPIKWNGTGNAAVLGGTPPVGDFGIQLNNYFFIGNTVANPSIIQWSILGNPEDWTGTGSGTQNVSKNDGDKLVGATNLGIDRLLLFKQNSIHEMVVRTPPFPVFPKFKGVGAVSKRGIVNVDDMIYFITPQARMKATDGYKIFDFPDTINNVWNGLNPARLQYIQGFYYPKLQQIWWICSNTTATANNYNIIWDLRKECWLRHPTGFGMNAVSMMQDYIPYGGAYDGKVYKLDVSSVYNDASEASPGAINAFWRSGWLDLQTMIQAKVIPYVDISFAAQTSGTFEFGYGFNLASDRKITLINMIAPGGLWNQGQWDVMMWGGQTDLVKLTFVKGNGKYFQYLIRNKNGSQPFQINGLEMPVQYSSSMALRTA